MQIIEIYVNKNDNVACKMINNNKEQVCSLDDTLEFLDIIKRSNATSLKLNGDAVECIIKDIPVRIKDFKRLKNLDSLSNIYEQVKIDIEKEKLRRNKKRKVNRIKSLAIGGAILVIGSSVLANAKGLKKDRTLENLEQEEIKVLQEDNTIKNEANVLNDVVFDIEPILLEYEDRSNDDKVINTKKNYGDIINKYANMYGVDPNLVLAIATQERGEHSSSIDQGGAIGLMQIQFNVWNNEILKAYNFSTNEYETVKLNKEYLSDVEGNIKAGCMIFQNSLKYMNNNIIAGIQCYNFGQGNMYNMLDEYAKDNKMTIEEVLSDQNNTSWMSYRNLINAGDSLYVEHVLSHLGNEISIYNNAVTGESYHVCISNSKSNVRS